MLVLTVGLLGLVVVEGGFPPVVVVLLLVVLGLVGMSPGWGWVLSPGGRAWLGARLPRGVGTISPPLLCAGLSIGVCMDAMEEELLGFKSWSGGSPSERCCCCCWDKRRRSSAAAENTPLSPLPGPPYPPCAGLPPSACSRWVEEEGRPECWCRRGGAPALAGPVRGVPVLVGAAVLLLFIDCLIDVVVCFARAGKGLFPIPPPATLGGGLLLAGGLCPAVPRVKSPGVASRPTAGGAFIAGYCGVGCWDERRPAVVLAAPPEGWCWVGGCARGARVLMLFPEGLLDICCVFAARMTFAWMGSCDEYGELGGGHGVGGLW